MESPLISYRATQNLKQVELAKELKITPSALCKWERGKVPPERVLMVETVTGIPRHQLRPDIYPTEAA